MKTYEFINPSDAILFDAPDDECAALAALVVGSGQCSAKEVGSEFNVIGFAFLGGDGGFKEIYGATAQERLTARIADVITAAHTFRIKSGERTSMNDFCGYAHSLTMRVPA
jgi:hypothetical protein